MMSNGNRTRWHRVALVLLSSASLAACGAGQATMSVQAGAEAEASVQIPRLLTTQATVLPLDAYKPTGEQMADLTSAVRHSLASCMNGFGFMNYTKKRIHSETAPFPKDRRYLFIDPAKAAQYGYAGAPDAELSAKPPSASSSTNSSKISPEEESVYTGKGQRLYKGRQVPEGGCLGAARQTVTRGVAADDEWLITQLEGQAFQRAEDDPRVAEVTAQWSACMKRAGYDYSTPAAAWEDPQWRSRRDGGALSDKEKATATADMNCKLEVNYLGVRVAAETEEQQRAIDARGDDLKKFQSNLQIKLANARKLLGD